MPRPALPGLACISTAMQEASREAATTTYASAHRLALQQGEPDGHWGGGGKGGRARTWTPQNRRRGLASVGQHTCSGAACAAQAFAHLPGVMRHTLSAEVRDHQLQRAVQKEHCREAG